MRWIQVEALRIEHFDILGYIKKAKEYGIREEFAEFNARQIERLTDTIQDQQIKLDAIEAKEPATKKDLEIVKLELQKEIAELKNSLVKWVMGAVISAVVILSGVVFTLLKFMLHPGIA